MKVAPREFETPEGRTFVIRSARPAEAGALFDHYLRIRTEEPDVNVEEVDEWGVTADGIRRLAASLERAPNGFLLVAEAEGGIVGILSVEGGRYRKVRHVGEVGVSVRRPWRRKGVGRRLLATAIEVAREAGTLSRLSLRVFASNTGALALYRAAGFAEEGRRTGYLRVRGRDEDLLLLGRAVGGE